MRIKNTVKNSFIFLFPFILLAYILFCINILIKDFSYGHKSHNLIFRYPVSWAFYEIDLFKKKLINNFFYNDNAGLDSYYVYVPDKSFSSLEKNIPNSTKNYVPGFYVDSNEYKRINLRYIGDNPDNWMFNKKSLRIKLRKDESNFLERYFEFKFPREQNELLQIIPYLLSDKLKILSPKHELVELYINNSSEGIFIKRERLNENFLRRNKIMPVNLYKGEQTNNSENKIGLEDNLFSNPGLWEKIAIQNKFNESNKDDLSYFLSKIIEAENSQKSIDEILENGNLENFALNEILLILLQSEAQDNGHNFRLAIDNWSGKIYNIPQDIYYSPINIKKENYIVDIVINDLFRVLNQSSKYLNYKYEKLYDEILNKEVINKIIFDLEKNKEKYLTSKKRDFGHIIFKNLKKEDLLKRELNLLDDNENYVDKTISSLKDRNNNLINLLKSNPNVSWQNNKNSFSIKIDGLLPVENLYIDFKNEQPKWIVLDLNNNNLVDDEDIYFYPDKDGKFFLDVKLFANRVPVRILEKRSYKKKLNTINTKFNFIVENNQIPINISSFNKFSKNKFTIKKSEKYGSLPALTNLPIIDLQKIKTKVFEGDIYLNKDLIIKEKTKVLPGTTFHLDEGISIIFKNRLNAIGTKNQPITFKSRNKNQFWGTLALFGNNSKGSKLKNIIIENASGTKKNITTFFSALSIHSTKNIKIENVYMKNNADYDDMIHIIYCENIKILNTKIENSFGDAIDVDLSENITFDNVEILNSKNDGLDFMESKAIIRNSKISFSGDKGISVGENSNIKIYNSKIKFSDIGLASKDHSKAYVYNSLLENNNTQLSVYKKNWRYKSSGEIISIRNKLNNKNKNEIVSKNNGLIILEKNEISKTINLDGKNIIIK